FGKLIRIWIQIAFQRVRFDAQRRDEGRIHHQAQRLLAVHQSLLPKNVCNLRHRQAFGDQDGMQHHLADGQAREDFGGRHARIELIFTGLDFPIRGLKPPQPDERQSALDEFFAFEQRGDLVKGGTVRNGHGLGRRTQSWRNRRLLGPLNGLIRGYAEYGGHAQEHEEKAAKLHQCCRLSTNLRPRPALSLVPDSPDRTVIRFPPPPLPPPPSPSSPPPRPP